MTVPFFVSTWTSLPGTRSSAYSAILVFDVIQLSLLAVAALCIVPLALSSAWAAFELAFSEVVCAWTATGAVASNARAIPVIQCFRMMSLLVTGLGAVRCGASAQRARALFPAAR